MLVHIVIDMWWSNQVYKGLHSLRTCASLWFYILLTSTFLPPFTRTCTERERERERGALWTWAFQQSNSDLWFGFLQLCDRAKFYGFECRSWSFYPELRRLWDKWRFATSEPYLWPLNSSHHVWLALCMFEGLEIFWWILCSFSLSYLNWGLFLPSMS